MHRFVIASLLFASAAARADSLWDAELRFGYGLSLVGGQGMSGARSSPLTIEASGALSISEDPALRGFAGVIAETLDRGSVGVVGGVILRAGRVRLRAGGIHVIAPYTLDGALASGGTCWRATRELRACGDVQIVEYFAGNDLVPGHAVTQIQLVAGVMFDAP